MLAQFYLLLVSQIIFEIDPHIRKFTTLSDLTNSDLYEQFDVLKISAKT